MNKVLVVGGGMAGLGAVLAGQRSGRALNWTLLEQAPAFSEVGAGIQLGPNAMRVLADWGLEAAVMARAALPEALQVREASSGKTLGRLMLGAAMRYKYGQAYATIHRADLHQILLEAVQQAGAADLQLDQRLAQIDHRPDGVQVRTERGTQLDADLLLACDGLRSRVRQQVWGDGPPVFSGHLAYRGMVRMDDLPLPLRRQWVSVWLGPSLHLVHYPVRGGEIMNVVAVVHGELPTEPDGWDHLAHATDLHAAIDDVAPELEEVLRRVPAWRLWPLHVRPAMRGAHQHVRGRVALLGDAAHPMRPYLAQGAAMALEDAWTLGQLMARPADASATPEAWLGRWAEVRWRRNAWVQERSRRNGTIFHARGPLRWGRDWAMATLGEKVMDVPQLYSGPPAP